MPYRQVPSRPQHLWRRSFRFTAATGPANSDRPGAGIGMVRSVRPSPARRGRFIRAAAGSTAAASGIAIGETRERLSDVTRHANRARSNPARLDRAPGGSPVVPPQGLICQGLGLPPFFRQERNCWPLLIAATSPASEHCPVKTNSTNVVPMRVHNACKPCFRSTRASPQG